MPNGTYGGVRGKETKVGQKTLKKKTICLIFLPQGVLFDHSIGVASLVYFNEPFSHFSGFYCR